MTTTAEKIAVMQAFERGEKVEARDVWRDAWHECRSPNWSWCDTAYRVAPKPIDLVEVLEAASRVYGLTSCCGHKWQDIIARAKELQG